MSLDKYIEAALHKIGGYYVAELKNRLAADGNVASQDLANSISSSVVKDAVVITANKYLQALSEGKKHTSKNPSPEMVKSVSRWMKFKGITPRRGGLTDSSYKRSAFAIARRINMSGWAGSKVIQKAFLAIENKVDKEITSAFKKEIQRLINDINKAQTNGNTTS